MGARRFLSFVGLVVLLGGGAFLAITRPATVDATTFADLKGDAVNGERLFWVGGCASCHAADGAEGDARLVLSGGKRLPTDFGTFAVPNISPDPVHGIGAWSVVDLANAMQHGTSPEGEHYYPAFPYTSYAVTTPQEIADLKAFLATLPASDRPNDPHELPFPFNQRLLLGGWKWLFLSTDPVVKAADLTADELHGRTLVEGLGHCGECHTPRNVLGGRDVSRWLAGGPNPEGKGKIPNITPAKLDWAVADIAEYLKTGFTPEYDSAGGSMADVVTNLSHLPDADRLAIAAYLKRVTPVE
jgi:mono/diheme cytochrome c family protein